MFSDCPRKWLLNNSVCQSWAETASRQDAYKRSSRFLNTFGSPILGRFSLKSSVSTATPLIARHSVIGIDQVLLPDPHELLQIRLIVLGNTPRIFAGLKLRQGQLIPQQLDQSIQLPIGGIELQQRGAKFQSKFRSIENRTVSHDHLHPTDALSA